MPDADLVARARELGAPMLAPEPAIARRSELLLALADRVEALEGLLREIEWGYYPRFCPVCLEDEPDGHLPGCRLARALGKGEKSGEAPSAKADGFLG